MLRTETKRRVRVIRFENPPSENEGGIFYALAVTVTGKTIGESRGRSARTLRNPHTIPAISYDSSQFPLISSKRQKK